MSLPPAFELIPAPPRRPQDNLRAALLSARAHAPSLVPLLIYTGPPNAFTRWWEGNGGHIAPHTLSFLDRLEAVRQRDGVWGAKLLNRQARRRAGWRAGGWAGSRKPLPLHERQTAVRRW